MKRMNRKGQNLVEFALVVPLLLLLLIGIAEFGRAWMARNIMTGAAREAVRVAAVKPGSGVTDNTWLARANAVLSSAALTGAVPTIYDDGTPFGTITVTVTYINYPLFIPGLGLWPGLGTIDLNSSTTMRKEY